MLPKPRENRTATLDTVGLLRLFVGELAFFDLINNRYDALRSQFRILRAVGMLSQSVHTRR